MSIVPQRAPQGTAIDGVAHATWASRADGLRQLSVWRQSLAAGAATPPHRHDCDEVVICLEGQGQLDTEGQQQSFGSGQVLILPRQRVHQFCNVGAQALEIIGILGQTPVRTCLPDGTPLDLPWQS